jgi:hypothetical protein
MGGNAIFSSSAGRPLCAGRAQRPAAASAPVFFSPCAARHSTIFPNGAAGPSRPAAGPPRRPGAARLCAPPPLPRQSRASITPLVSPSPKAAVSAQEIQPLHQPANARAMPAPRAQHVVPVPVAKGLTAAQMAESLQRPLHGGDHALRAKGMSCKGAPGPRRPAHAVKKAEAVLPALFFPTKAVYPTYTYMRRKK